MTLLLLDGDYVPDASGKLTSLDEVAELLQEVMLRLTLRRGSFPLLPELGSRLYLLPGESPKNREALARQYVMEALEGLTEVRLRAVRYAETGEGAAQVTVTLLWRDEKAILTINV